MSHDFRPYIQPTPHGVRIKLDDLYIYKDHGNLTVAAVPDKGLPGLNQPFADPYQGFEIWARVLRMMWKEAKKRP